MAKTKLTNDQIEILNTLGFKGTTDEEVRPAILKKLEDYDVFEVDEDPIEDLIGIVQAFMEIEGDTVSSKEDDSQDLDDVETSNEVEEEEEEVEEEEELEEELEEEVKPEPKKVEKPKVEKPKVEKPKVEKPKTATTKKTERVVYNGENKDHVEKIKSILEPYLKRFALEATYNKSCVPLTLKESDSKRSLICVESIVFKGDETSVKVYFNGMNLFKKTNDLKEMMEGLLEEQFYDRLCIHNNNSYPFVKSVDSNELDKLLKAEIIDSMKEKISSFDKKLRKNRERMEQEYEKK